MTRTLLLFGAGPGIGNNVAATFASAGIEHIVLLGRNTERLSKEDVPFVQNAASSVKVDTLTADLSDLESIPKMLKDLDALTQGDDIEIVYYNAARIKPTDPVLDVSVQEIDEDFRTQVLALHLVSKHYIPILQSTAKSSRDLKPALFVTNSHLPWDPIPQLISLSLVKGAQRTQVISLSRAFNETGVHCALINVQGVVDPKSNVFSPKNIAKEVVEFWKRGDGFEVNVKE